MSPLIPSQTYYARFVDGWGLGVANEVKFVSFPFAPAYWAAKDMFSFHGVLEILAVNSVAVEEPRAELWWPECLSAT
jgi:hypothetical protein